MMEDGVLLFVKLFVFYSSEFFVSAYTCWDCCYVEVHADCRWSQFARSSRLQFTVLELVVRKQLLSTSALWCHAMFEKSSDWLKLKVLDHIHFYWLCTLAFYIQRKMEISKNQIFEVQSVDEHVHR